MHWALLFLLSLCPHIQLFILIHVSNIFFSSHSLSISFSLTLFAGISDSIIINIIIINNNTCCELIIIWTVAAIINNQ